MNRPDDVAVEVTTVLEAAPEFALRYLELLRAADGDPGAAATFVELADFVADLLAQLERHRPVLLRCLAAVEEVAERSPDAEDLVGWSFLDGLAPGDRTRLAPWLGPRTRDLLDAVEHSGP